MNFRDVQEEVGEWSIDNFGEQDPHNPLKGVQEELGEFTHSDLKRDQGIRLEEDGVGDEAEKDAIGDMFIYLCDYAYRMNVWIDPGITEPQLNYSKNNAWCTLSTRYGALCNIHGTSVDYQIQDSVNKVARGIWILASAYGYDFKECVQMAWYGEVKTREWDSSYK